MLGVLVVSERRASACLIMLSARQVATGSIFNAFGMARPDLNPRPPAPEANALPFALSGPVQALRSLAKFYSGAKKKAI